MPWKASQSFGASFVQKAICEAERKSCVESRGLRTRKRSRYESMHSCRHGSSSEFGWGSNHRERNESQFENNSFSQAILRQTSTFSSSTATSTTNFPKDELRNAFGMSNAFMSEQSSDFFILADQQDEKSFQNFQEPASKRMRPKRSSLVFTNQELHALKRYFVGSEPREICMTHDVKNKDN